MPKLGIAEKLCFLIWQQFSAFIILSHIPFQKDSWQQPERNKKMCCRSNQSQSCFLQKSTHQLQAFIVLRLFLNLCSQQKGKTFGLLWSCAFLQDSSFQEIEALVHAYSTGFTGAVFNFNSFVSYEYFMCSGNSCFSGNLIQINESWPCNVLFPRLLTKLGELALHVGRPLCFLQWRQSHLLCAF